MDDLRPSASPAISHNSVALNTFVPSHRRLSSSQTLIPAPSNALYKPPPQVAILNSLSPVYDTRTFVPPATTVPKKSNRHSMRVSEWESSNESLTSGSTPEGSILGPLKRIVSPFKRTDSLEASHSSYRPSISKSTPSSLRSRSNSGSSSQSPLASGESLPAKPYHYTTRRTQTHPVIPEKPLPNVITAPPEVIRNKAMTTQTPSPIPNPSNRAKEHDKSRETDTDLAQRETRPSGVENAHHQTVIRELEPQSRRTGNKPLAPEKEQIYTEKSVPRVVPSHRKESLPQFLLAPSKDQGSSQQKPSSKTNLDASKTSEPPRMTPAQKQDHRISIFQPHLVPIPQGNDYPRVVTDDDEPPGTPGIRRRDERNGWSGEWNQANIQEVIDKLRALR